ncbi:MAG: hypothetical protein M0Q49_09940 [Porticoccaceae bacterium]|nr:hypothetical protein [Porticoccaceae bacterium]
MASGPEILSTQLLGEALSAFTPAHQPLRILDLGPASSATVAFFSQYRCTLRFADLDPTQLHLSVGNKESVGDEEPAGDEVPGDKTQLQWLQQQLDLPAGSTFDLCLFWDVLNHLDESGVKALGALLKPHLHGGSRGHGFAVHNRGAALCHRIYGILDASQLVVTAQDESLPLRYPHSQSALNSTLGCLAAKRSVLRSDGRLEMVLAAAG